MRIAITGTPGTGKTSACRVLVNRGYVALDLNLEAERLGHLGPPDGDGVREVDTEGLARDLEPAAKVTFLYSHFAHLLPSNIVIVLRCHPKFLRQRLEARGWSPAKVRENVEAEAIDLITQEAVEGGAPVFEIDTTTFTPDQTATAILEILQGQTRGREPGAIDWTDEVLSWF